MEGGDLKKRFFFKDELIFASAYVSKRPNQPPLLKVRRHLVRPAGAAAFSQWKLRGLLRYWPCAMVLPTDSSNSLLSVGLNAAG